MGKEPTEQERLDALVEARVQEALRTSKMTKQERQVRGIVREEVAAALKEWGSKIGLGEGDDADDDDDDDDKDKPRGFIAGLLGAE